MELEGVYIKQFVIIGCIFSTCATPPPYAKHAQEVAKTFAERVQQEQGLHALGSGGFYTNKKIDSLYLDFECTNNPSPTEAKALLMDVATSFIEYIHQQGDVRPFLQTYPMTLQQISVSIAFLNRQGTPVEGFSQIDLCTGTIHYSTFDVSQKKYVTYSSEPTGTLPESDTGAPDKPWK